MMFEHYISKEHLEKLLPTLAQYSVRVLGAIALFCLAVVVSNYLKKLVLLALNKGHVEPTLTKFLGNVVKWGVLAMSVISIMGILGIQTTSFAAMIAAMGLAIGLAFQGTLSNFAAGVMLLLFRPFKVGDQIKVAGETGIVDEISIFTTSMDTSDKRRIILPNSAVFGATIENASHHPTRRCDITISTAYDADLQTTKEILLKALKDIADILPTPPPSVTLSNLGASSIDWAVQAFVKKENYGAVRESMMWNCKMALDRRGIAIPFPQMDVHFSQELIEALRTTKTSNTQAPQIPASAKDSSHHWLES